MKEKRSVYLGILTAIFAASLFITHSAALSITTSAVSFPAVSLNGQDQVVLGSTSAWQADAAGESGGWNATISATNFTNGFGGSIYISNLEFRLADANITLVSGDPTLPSTSQANYASLSESALKFISAASGTGDGIYDFLPEFRLTVPAETYTGNYTSTLTITMSTGP
ncbi:MAG: hypothetical protein HN392_03485 [Anaerolineae bacterium]|jgi:hypothetical protein|nr:hypothetical protein [Anaerolineae bacterium]